MNVKFSILIPVYNVEKYLDECIQSVLAQTYTNYELILVNDGSRDSSGEICDRYAQQYSQIRAFHKENRGQLHTREYAIQQATGEFYVFLDSDDYLENNALAVIHDNIERHGCDCVIYGMQRVTDEGKIVGTITEKAEQERVIENRNELFKLMFTNTIYNPLCRKAIRAAADRCVDYSKFYHVRHGEDMLQSIELLEKVQKTVLIPDVLYNYRVNLQSVTQTVSYEKYRVDFSVREYVWDYIEKNHLFSEQDWKEYVGYAILLIIDELQTIASFRTAYSNKKQLFQEIYVTPYCNKVMTIQQYDKKVTGKKHFLFALFKEKRYMAVIVCVTVFRLLRKMLNN